MKKFIILMIFCSMQMYSYTSIKIKIDLLDRLTEVYLDGEKIQKSPYQKKSFEFETLPDSWGDTYAWDLVEGTHKLELIRFLDDGRMYYYKTEAEKNSDDIINFDLKKPDLQIISSENYYYKKAIDLKSYNAYLRRFPYGNYSKEIMEKKKLIYKEKMKGSPENTDFILAYLFEFPNSPEAEELLTKYIELGGNLNSINLKDNMVFVEGGNLHVISSEREKVVYDDFIREELITYDTSVGNFAIGKYEVTQEEFTEIMGYNPSKFKKKNRPVESLSWLEAIKFCNELSIKNGFKPAYDEESGQFIDKEGNLTTDTRKVEGYRLPTEAEWEYAAKGGVKSEGYRFIGANYVDEVAWTSFYKKTKEVALLKANELGIYDMGGNVFEWCSDYNGGFSHFNYPNPYNSIKDSHRIIRGGGFRHPASDCTASNRSIQWPDFTAEYTGFRIARSLSADK